MPEASVEKILGEHFPHKREIVRMYEYERLRHLARDCQDLGQSSRAKREQRASSYPAQAATRRGCLAGAALAGINNNVILLVNANPKIEGVQY